MTFCQTLGRKFTAPKKRRRRIRRKARTGPLVHKQPAVRSRGTRDYASSNLDPIVHKHGYATHDGNGSRIGAAIITGGTTYYRFDVYNRQGTQDILTDSDGNITVQPHFNAFGQVLGKTVTGPDIQNRFGYHSNWITLPDSNDDIIESFAGTYVAHLGIHARRGPRAEMQAMRRVDRQQTSRSLGRDSAGIDETLPQLRPLVSGHMTTAMASVADDSQYGTTSDQPVTAKMHVDKGKWEIDRRWWRPRALATPLCGTIRELAAILRLDPSEANKWLRRYTPAGGWVQGSDERPSVALKEPLGLLGLDTPFHETDGVVFSIPNTAYITLGDKAGILTYGRELSDFAKDIKGRAWFNMAKKFGVGVGYYVKDMSSRKLSTKLLNQYLGDRNIAIWFHYGHGYEGNVKGDWGCLDVGGGTRICPRDLRSHHKLALIVLMTCFAGRQNWTNLYSGLLVASKESISVSILNPEGNEYHNLPVTSAK